MASAPSVVSAVRVRPNRRNGPNANGSGIGFASVIVNLVRDSFRSDKIKLGENRPSAYKCVAQLQQNSRQ